MPISPYLTFDGSCEEAFTFYNSVFRGKSPYVVRYRDLPFDLSCDQGNKIMHISLSIGYNAVLVGSDVLVSGLQIDCPPIKPVLLRANSETEAKHLFKVLSVGGAILKEITDSLIGAISGQFTDRFGIEWKIIYP